MPPIVPRDPGAYGRREKARPCPPGERRALAAQRHLVALGVDMGRVRTVSYGKEFPFDPDHDEDAWAANRRAHFVITAQ